MVVIAQLAQRLAAHPSWSGVGWFVFLYYAVWSSWINRTLYYDLHGTNDVSVRLFTFLQMLAVAVMAVFVRDVPGDGAHGFALGFAANTVVLVVLWFRTGWHDPHHRVASVPYSASYLVAAMVFAASAATDPPVIYWLWAIALLIELVGQLAAYRVWTPPMDQGGAVFAATPSLIERLDIFVIIVLGEVIVGSVNGMADLHPITTAGIVIGLLGMLVAIGLWWVHFDLVSGRAPTPSRTQLWLYLHLPLVIAMAAVGASLLNTVEHAIVPLPGDARWLLVGACAVGRRVSRGVDSDSESASFVSHALSDGHRRARRQRPRDRGGRLHRLGCGGNAHRDGPSPRCPDRGRADRLGGAPRRARAR